MTHAVHIAVNSSLEDKQLLCDLQNQPDEKPFDSLLPNKNQKEYMNSNDFRASVKKELIDKLKTYGRL